MSKKETKTAQIIRILRANHHDTDRVIAFNIGCTPSLVAKVRRSGKHYVTKDEARIALAAQKELPRVEGGNSSFWAGIGSAEATYELDKAEKISQHVQSIGNSAYKLTKDGPNTAGVDPNAWTRTGILNQAEQYVTKDRAATHGDMEDNFSRIAKYWTLHLGRDGDPNSVTPEDVATMMALLKIARLKANPTNADNWIDTAGYMACGGELATQKAHK